jgi:ABC-type bacteriocin/lantibiotic exporter with double-glycine peptidase domain
MRRFCIVLIFFITLFILNTLLLLGKENNHGKSENQNKEENTGDLICGPKCVKKILQWYKKEDEDIIRLVREIQWPDVQKGASIGKIAQALEKRGIHTFAMKVKSSARIVWQYPVIIHIKPKKEQNIGHFVVWLPTSEKSVVSVYDGDFGIFEYNERQWSNERSGSVLLTSIEPIKTPYNSVVFGGYDVNSQPFIVVSLIIFVSGCVCFTLTFFPTQLFLKGEKNEFTKL